MNSLILANACGATPQTWLIARSSVNEKSKLLCASALVALGLGLAFLCGSPADLPEVLVDSPRLQARVGPADMESELSPLRLQANRTVQRDAFDSAARGIVLSAGVMESIPKSSASELRERDSASEHHHWVPLPLPEELDKDAVPLTSVSKTGPADSRDDWLLKPPIMPRTFGSKATGQAGTSSYASSSASSSTSTEDCPWWTQDTPRLQGLSASTDSPVSALSINSPPGNMVSVQPAPPKDSLVGPIPLDSRPFTAVASAKVASPEFQTRSENYRTHLVADGDTLTRLAERYLKDPNRAREILELNRDVLTDPDLLPIGAPLRIPGQLPQNDLDGEAATSGSRMVPVATSPHSVDAQPRAELHGPAPLASNGW